MNPLVFSQMAQAASQTPTPALVPTSVSVSTTQQASPEDVIRNVNMYKSLLPGYQQSPEMMQMLGNYQKTGEEDLAQQRDEIQRQKDLAALYAQAPTKFDYRPLAAFSDTMFGGNLSKMAEQSAPESPKQKFLEQVSLQQKIGEATAGLTKAKREQMAQALTQMGYEQQRRQAAEKERLDKAVELEKIRMMGGFQGARAATTAGRLEQQVEKEARATFNTDPILKLYVPRLEGAAKIGELIQSSKEGKVVTNSVFLHQLNQEITRLETGASAVAEGTIERTSLEDAKAKLAAITDTITGNPTDSVRPEVIDAARKMVEELSSSYQRGIEGRMDYLTSGMTPVQKQIAAEKKASLIKAYAPRLGGWQGGSQENNAGLSPEKQKRLEELRKKLGK
jgi:hypothetical protein